MDGKTAVLLMMIATIIGGFSAYMAFLPNEFYLVGTKPSYYGVSYPAHWTMQDYANFTYDMNASIFRNTYTPLDFRTATPPFEKTITVQWIYVEGVFDYIQMSNEYLLNLLSFENASTIHLTESIIINRFDSEFSIFYLCFSGDFICKVWLGDYNVTRNNIQDAWDEGELYCEVAFGSPESEIIAGYVQTSGWNVLWNILTFQAPEIFGTGTTGILLNSLIAIPLWALIGAIIAIAIFELIPF